MDNGHWPTALNRTHNWYQVNFQICNFQTLCNGWYPEQTAKLPVAQCQRALSMISQHWWFGDVRAQAITWTNVHPDIYCFMASPGHNELNDARWIVSNGFEYLRLDRTGEPLRYHLTHCFKCLKDISKCLKYIYYGILFRHSVYIYIYIYKYIYVYIIYKYHILWIILCLFSRHSSYENATHKNDCTRQ